MDLLLWIFIVMIVLFLSAGVSALLFFIIDFFSKKRARRRIPYDDGVEGLADPKEADINERRYKEIERAKFDKSREWEKLRHELNSKPRSNGKGLSESQISDAVKGLGLIPPKHDNSDSGSKLLPKQDSGSSGKARKSVKLHKPADI